MDLGSATIYTDEDLDDGLRAQITERLNARAGVNSTNIHAEKPHILTIKFDGNEVTAQDLLQIVLDTGAYAKMVG